MGAHAIQLQREGELRAQYGIPPGVNVTFVYSGGGAGNKGLTPTGIVGYGPAPEVTFRNLNESNRVAFYQKQHEAESKAYQDTAKQFSEIGATPIYDKGQLTGYQTSTQSVAFTPQQRTSIQIGQPVTISSGPQLQSISQSQTPTINNQQVTTFGITGSAIKNPFQNAYDTQIKSLSDTSLKQSNITITKGWGDNEKGFSIKDIIGAGYYDSQKKEIYVNQFATIGGLFNNQVIQHEFGHYLTQDMTNFTLFNKSGSSNVDRVGEQLVGQSSSYSGWENAADSFQKYVANPTSFKQKYLDVASLFETKIGYNQSQATTPTSPKIVTMGVSIPMPQTFQDYKAAFIAPYIGMKEINYPISKQTQSTNKLIFNAAKSFYPEATDWTQTKEGFNAIVKGKPIYLDYGMGGPLKSNKDYLQVSIGKSIKGATEIGTQQQFISQMPKPVMSEVIPTTFTGKLWEGAKTLYIASPFGSSVPLPQEYNIARTTGKSSYLNVLTLSQAQSAIREEKLKEMTAGWQTAKIGEFQITDTTGLSDTQKYNQFWQGRLNLAAAGISTSDITMPGGEKGISFTSQELTPSVSTDVYQYQKETSGWGKALLETRIVSTKATEMYGLSYGLELAQITPAIGMGFGYLTSGGLGTIGKVAGYSSATLLVGGIVAGKTIEGMNAPSKPVFALQTIGEVAGFGAYLETEGYGIQYKNWATDQGNVKSVYVGGKPLITQNIEGKTSLGFPKTNPFGSTLPQDIYDTKIGASFANRFVSQVGFSNPANLQVVQEGFEATKILRTVNYKGDINLDLSKSRYFEGFNPEAKQVTVNFLQEEGKKSVGWKGFFNTVTNQNRLTQVYGSASSVSKGALTREFGDIDIQFSGKGMPKAQELFENLNKAQPNTFKLTEGTSLIEMKQPTGDYVHIFDIHGIDTPDLMVSGTPLGFKQQSPVTSLLEGKKVPTSTVGTEATGKAQSVLKFRQPDIMKLKGYTGTGTLINPSEYGKLEFNVPTSISPEAHRMKDIPDWYNILESLNKQAGTKAINLAPLKIGLESSFGKLGSGGQILFASSTTTTSVIPSLGLAGASRVLSSFKSPITSPSKILVSSFSISSSKISSQSYSTFKISPSIPKSLSPSVSPSSKSLSSFSPSVSPSSKSLSSFSPSVSPSYYSSPFPSKSPSPSRSRSPSPYPSFSPSFSPSPSLSPSPALSPFPYVPPSLFSLPKFGSFDFGSLGKGFKSGKQRTKYTPSYSAFVFKIKGKAPKGLETGTRLRPITKGFSWKNLFRGNK